MPDLVRVLTFNLLALSHASGQQRHRVIKRGLAELRPDVVALQEVTRAARCDQAADLLGPDFSIVDHPAPSPDGVGACLASRWPLGATHALDLHITPRAVGLSWAATVAVEVLVPPPLGPLLVVHHKPNWQLDREYEREQQAVAAARFVEHLVAGRPNLPVILVGDFDAGPDAASVRFWSGRQSLADTSVRYEDAWEAQHANEPGHTFTPRNPLVRAGEMPLERGRRSDHVMVRCNSHGPLLDVVDCRVVFDQPVDGVWASDHFGVLADLQLPARFGGSWA
jgi:endonuclease/exonuclease/phosphatase family metal-dependent hydrolase